VLRVKTLEAVVEIPRGSSVKYEFDKNDARLVVDRISELSYPYNYGFFEGTLSEDGDPLDVYILQTPELVPGACVAVEVVAVVYTEDGGLSDPKVLAIPTFSEDKRLDAGTLEEVVNFLENYKESSKVVKVEKNRQVAEHEVAQAEKRYRQVTFATRRTIEQKH